MAVRKFPWGFGGALRICKVSGHGSVSFLVAVRGLCDYATELLVHIAAMANACDGDDHFSIVDDVDNAVLADANPILVVSAFEFLAACGSRILFEAFEFGNDTSYECVRQPFEFFASTLL